WPAGNNPRLLENGNILDVDTNGFRGFLELDWDGNRVWEYNETRERYHPHHDFVRIFNPKLNEYTTMYIANKDLTHDECISAGCDPLDGPYDNSQIDAIVEVDIDGNIIWEWWFFDHAVQDIDPTKANYVGEGKTIADYPGRINLNLPGKPVKRDWLHCNSLDYNEELDQVVINSVHGEFYVIDHGNTFIPSDPEGSITLAASSLGDFLYRFGDPARYEQGEPPSILEDWTKSTTGHKQIGGSHDIQWIAPGLPGEGNFLVFNNGQYLFERTPQSYIFEINGFFNADGNDIGDYVNPPDAGYYTWDPPSRRETHKQPKQMSNQIVWIYNSKSNQAFFSHIGSGCQRLPNGNTLICAMTEGHFFEVTSEGELVWEYINPVTADGVLEIMPDNYPMTNSIFRVYRYGSDYPALISKDLAPNGTITDRTPEYEIPEFPSWIILPLFLFATLLAILIKKTN
ncbi:aryl-sulfate sulfotransferase, partial [Candidatus Bathyarchaeota archaeon]|nr:aryl-sulfate sulfotransferase [Candidatus Bathyarchaeota archaeon]